MKRLLKYLNNYKKESVLGPLFKLMEASFELFVPLVVARMIDTGIAGRDTAEIGKMGAILVLLGAIGLLCSITAQYFAAKASVGFGAELRNDLLAHINSFAYQELDQLGTATLITRMTSDVNQLQAGLNLGLRLFLRSPFIVFGAMIMALFVDRKSVLVFGTTIVLLSVVVFGIMLISMPLYKKVQKHLDQVLLTTRENLTGVRVVRAFNCQQKERNRFERENSQLVQAQVFVGKISALMNPATYLILNGALILLILSSGHRVNAGDLTQGEVVALVNYMSQILVELIKLANLIITISKASASASRIASLFEVQSSLDMSADDHPNPVTDPPLITFNNVGFAYHNSLEHSLSELSFTVSKGQLIGIIGSTGSGKTTLVNLLSRFYDATSGSIVVNGKDIRTYSPDQLRAVIGLVPQQAVLFQGSVRHNICWGKEDASDEEIRTALEAAQALDFVMDKPAGLDFHLNQGGKNLSGGQRQRLTIARALVKRPEILILDDSTSALDYVTDARLRSSLRKMSDDMTVFLISQRVASIQAADQILVLEEGRLAGLGPHSELLESCEVYQEIYRSQIPEEVRKSS